MTREAVHQGAEFFHCVSGSRWRRSVAEEAQRIERPLDSGTLNQTSNIRKKSDDDGHAPATTLFTRRVLAQDDHEQRRCRRRGDVQAEELDGQHVDHGRQQHRQHAPSCSRSTKTSVFARLAEQRLVRGCPAPEMHDDQADVEREVAGARAVAGPAGAEAPAASIMTTAPSTTGSATRHDRIRRHRCAPALGRLASAPWDSVGAVPVSGVVHGMRRSVAARPAARGPATGAALLRHEAGFLHQLAGACASALSSHLRNSAPVMEVVVEGALLHELLPVRRLAHLLQQVDVEGDLVRA